MQESSNREASPGLSAGRLEGISVPDLLWAFSLREKTGTLMVTRNGIKKTVYFQDGRVVFASSSDPDDRLGELLLREKMITLANLEEVLTRLNTGKRIGALLVDAGYLEPDELVNGVLLQVRNIITDLFMWETGEYQFEEGPLETVEVITLGTHTGDIILQGVRRLRSFTMIRRGVGPSRAWYRLSGNHQDVLDSLNMSEGERMLVAELKGDGASVEGLCRQVFLSNFEIYQALWAFKVLGVVHEVEHLGGEFSDAVIEGRFGKETVSPLLARLCHNEDTGVLQLVRGSMERTIHIMEGRCVFATSNSPDDGLMAYLLRRGVISLKDREETARRLLSNKRVGTILLEMGVIDEHDLQSVVREHLLEIIYDCLNWDRGDFSFMSGSLPTMEEITLDEPVEELVARGMERIGSWSRIREGLGGLDLILQLTPGFLEILDRMTIGPEEWEVISALKEPASAMEICSRVKLGDFRICQILWTLRILSAITPAPENEVAEEPPVYEDEEAEVVPVTVADESGDLQDNELYGYADAMAEAEAQVTDDLAEALEVSTPPAEEIQVVPEAEEPYNEDDPLDGYDEDREPFDAGRTVAISRDLVEAAITAASPEAETFEADAIEPEYEPEPEPEPEPLLEPEGDPEFESWEETDEEVDAEDLEDTLRLSREQVDEALDSGDPGSWEPPVDLDRQISVFNAGQRVVFRTIRAEVGAGAANFVRSCCGDQGAEIAGLFRHAELQTDGTWEVDGLRRAVVENRISDPSARYRGLLDLEMEMLKLHIGEARIASLQEQVDALLQVER
ncbi:MAG: DUF4388 domain-containing protein [Acidobacteria bacterium]|uniref:DUF4388 domain-containing protein n=1 Tax=Candidatus Polarisedimenticola svalbardensis TaxID=2886004 RepID=A0A8J6XX78_9BACT|nr:DUF4388 domain-containing protein [Candidatus Polarisedimenticola svalbardensis]